jgi:hypothetical protein
MHAWSVSGCVRMPHRRQEAQSTPRLPSTTGDRASTLVVAQACSVHCRLPAPIAPRGSARVGWGSEFVGQGARLSVGVHHRLQGSLSLPRLRSGWCAALCAVNFSLLAWWCFSINPLSTHTHSTRLLYTGPPPRYLSPLTLRCPANPTRPGCAQWDERADRRYCTCRARQS